MLPSLTREFIITFVCSRNSCSLPLDRYMNGIFRINNFRGRFVSTGRIPGIFFSLFMKNFEELGFSQVFMENKWKNSEPAGFSSCSCWRKVGELTTRPRKNFLPEKYMDIFHSSLRLFRYLGIIS